MRLHGRCSCALLGSVQLALPAPAAFQFPALALNIAAKLFIIWAVVVDYVDPIFETFSA